MIPVMAPSRWRWLAVGYVALGLAAWVAAPTADPDGWWLHGLWCVAGLALALPTLLVPLKTDFSLTLTDHRIAFLTGFAVFLLFGASFLTFGSEAGVKAVMQYYPLTVNQALRVDALNGGGFGLALFVSSLVRGRWLGGFAADIASRVAPIPVRSIVLVTFVVGTVATVRRLSFAWGYEAGTLSGVWTLAGQLLLVTILLLAADRGPRERKRRWFAVTLALVLALVGGLQFMKQAVLEPLLALITGLAMRFGAGRVLPAGLAALVGVFILLGDVVGQGRQAGGFYLGRISVEERFQFMVDGWDRSRDLDEEQRYSSWARLMQVHSEAAAMDLHDIGEGENGEPALFWVLVPRFLAPQKPSFTLGSNLHEKITGRRESSDAMSLFVSGYYYSGWWGFLIASILSGWIVAQTSAVARAIQERGAIVMLPLTLLGVFISLGAGGDFLSSFLATFMYVAYAVVAVRAGFWLVGWTAPAAQPDEGRA